MRACWRALAPTALISDDPLKAIVEADGVIDFSTPASTVALAGLARRRVSFM